MRFQFQSFADFWLMNGHGPYVWSAYLITAMVLGYLLISAYLQHRLFIKRQRKAQRLARQTNQ